jgi:hypothetical protein
MRAHGLRLRIGGEERVVHPLHRQSCTTRAAGFYHHLPESAFHQRRDRGDTAAPRGANPHPHGGQRNPLLAFLQARPDPIHDEIWLKLWGNACLNPISAPTHATLDVVPALVVQRAKMAGLRPRSARPGTSPCFCLIVLLIGARLCAHRHLPIATASCLFRKTKKDQGAPSVP